MTEIVQHCSMLQFSLPFTEFSTCKTRMLIDVIFGQKSVTGCQIIKALNLQQIEYLTL